MGWIARELRSRSTAFVAYQAVHGELPTYSHLTLPAGMEDFIDDGGLATGRSQMRAGRPTFMIFDDP